VKVIFSRKGFDAANGGCASPIFADGSLASLPIPSSRSPTRYSEIQASGRNSRCARIVIDRDTTWSRLTI
jgi:hypothetical protein